MAMMSPTARPRLRRMHAPMAVVSVLAVAAASGCVNAQESSTDPTGAAELFGDSESGDTASAAAPGDDTLDELLLDARDAPQFGLVRTPMSHWAQQEYVRRHALVHEDGSSTEFVLDPEECEPFDQSLWQSGVDIENSALSGALVDEMLLTVLITSETDRYDDLDALLTENCEEVRMRPVTRSATGEVVGYGHEPEESGEAGQDYINGNPVGITWFRNIPLETEAPDGVSDFMAMLQFQESTDESLSGAENVYLRGVVDGVAVDVSVSSVFGGSVDQISAAAIELFEEQVDKISELH